MKKLILTLALVAILVSGCSLTLTPKSGYDTYENDLDYTNDNLKANGPYTQNALPSTGDVNVLVVPVNFSSQNKTTKNLDRIKSAFSGDCEWVSVSEYYKQSSFGKLNLTFDVIDWYTPANTSSYYAAYEDEYDDGSTILLREIMDNYDSTIDFSKYDSDNDGYVDSVWMIYNNSTTTGSFWWAFSYVNQTEDKWDKKKVRYYAFAGIDFLGNSDLVDSTTFIHETGHLLGLDDYYSYNYDISPVYGLDMMDNNMGDHSSISKILLGWITPKVITESQAIDVLPYVTSGDVILISDHEITTIYDEYFLIDYYTGEGLDEYHKMYRFDGEVVKGIRVYHVDATINTNEKNEIIYNGGEYSSPFKYDNTDGYDNFVRLLPANRFPLSSEKTGAYLYKPDSISFEETYSALQYHSKNYINFTMVVNTIEDTKANLTISFI